MAFCLLFPGARIVIVLSTWGEKTNAKQEQETQVVNVVVAWSLVADATGEGQASTTFTQLVCFFEIVAFIPQSDFYCPCRSPVALFDSGWSNAHTKHRNLLACCMADNNDN